MFPLFHYIILISWYWCSLVSLKYHIMLATASLLKCLWVIMMVHHTCRFLLYYVFIDHQNYSLSHSLYINVLKIFSLSLSPFSITDHLPSHPFSSLLLYILCTYFLNLQIHSQLLPEITLFIFRFLYTHIHITSWLLVTTDSRHPKMVVNFLTDKKFSYTQISSKTSIVSFQPEKK